jgi:thiol:disulfide interchange protein DsbD
MPNIARILLSFLILSTSLVKAQILDPVQWSFRVENVSPGVVNLIMEANLDEHWHLYTQTVPNSLDAPLPTTFTFEANKEVEFIGKVKESKSITAYEEVIGLELSYFADHAVFTQKVKNITSKPVKVNGNVEFMTCDDHMCLPPEVVEFSFDIPAALVEKEKTTEVVEAAVTESADVSSETNEIYDPVTWTFKVEKAEGDQYSLIASADIADTWHLYARTLESDEGPIATVISFDENENIEFVGEIQDEGEMKSDYDPNFMMNVNYFEHHVDFVQKVKLKGKGAKIKGNVYFMTCDDTKCLPPEQVDFEVEAGEITLPDEGEEETIGSGMSFWATFLKGFFGGFIALLTPCVFPMIPLTVSFFTKQSKTRAKGISNAILYGSSIIAIYVILGYGVTALFGSDALNILSTNPWFNVAFFVLLTVFAISFFGAFEITLPSSWVNKADSASDKGGLLGIFFMAFTLSLVSFSCTGPIIGTLLVDAAVNGGILGPVVGMFGFSLALALPFGLFAAFPGWLNSLPSSGGWLNSVKVVLGFLELAFAFKFLSNADLVIQAGLLKRELFIAIWIAIFGMMTAYLLGFFSLPHDSKSDKISVTRMVFAVFSLMFTIYLIPGLWGAPLKIISGFPPPMFYSESPQGLGGSANTMVISNEGGEMVGDPAHCPHQLNCFHDYDEGLAYAKEVGKPVLLDFTGWACVNCRKMEEQVWSDPSVLKILREEIVLISLYVDEDIPLPESEQVEVQIGKKTKKLKTVGNKWSYMQASRYNTNSQPYYVVLDHNEVTMNGSAAYDPDIPKFLKWLEEGITRFKSKK